MEAVSLDVAIGGSYAPGSGLGLAIVRNLAGLYGRSIALESSPSGGVRACLELPAAEEGS